jgi:glycosyltransferase involved in cell wall biosynthesis
VTYRALLPRVLELHRRIPFDVFHLATWGDFSLAASWIAKELGIPFIASAIGGYENKYFDKPGTVPYNTMREVFLNSDKVMCVSEDLRRKVDLVTEGRAHPFVFYSGVDTAVFRRNVGRGQQVRRELGIGPNTRLILFVGRIGPDKGIAELLEAYRRLRSRYSDLALALVGPAGNRRWLERQLRRLGLEDTVHVLGPREPVQIPGYLNAADVFAFPSWMEGLPNSVVEACACETAVVASRVGGVPEILQDGVSGLLVEPRDIEELHGKLEILIGDAGLRRRLGRAGAERVAELFDYERNTAVFATHFKEVVKKGGHSKSRTDGSAAAHGGITVSVPSLGKTGSYVND